MDYSRRHHPPPPPPGGAPLHGAICPVCSISHFPFCPPPVPQNHPIYQYPPPPHPDQFYPRPPPPPPHQPTPPAAPYDPFVDHRSGPGMNPYPLPADPQRPWSTSSGFDKEPYGNLYPGFDYSNIGAKRMAFNDSGNVGAKRFRSDDSYFTIGPPEPYMNEPFVNSSRVSTENERRLKLVREHGGAMSHDADRNLDAKTDMGIKASNNSEAGYGNVDRKGAYFDHKNGLNGQKYGEEQFGQQHRNQADSGSHQSKIYGYSGHPSDNYSNTKQPRKSQEAMGHNWQGVSVSSAAYNDHKGGFPLENRDVHNQFSQKYTMKHHVEPKLNHYGSPYLKNKGDSWPNQSGMSNGLAQDPRLLSGRPPLPSSPPPPLPMEPPGPHLSDPAVSPGTSASLFPIPVASSAVAASSYPPHSEAGSLPSAYYPNRGHPHSTGFVSEEFQANWQAPPKRYLGGGNEVGPLQSLSPEKPKIVDASHIIKHPHRATRPDHIVIILRGLPGSGKSYLAKMLRDLEVENGGNVPRIHSMDDYFMTEVEKIEESEPAKSSGSIRGKKQVTKKVIEYCYEPEMEEAYRSSMLKAFKKTLDEGVFSFIIVDDRNLRVADFAQFWATAKRSGYEVYLLEATYKDPVGCAARNVHGFSQDDIQKMADLWEEAPSLYLKLDIKTLLHGDGLEEGGIQEVDMDMEDGDPVGGGISISEERNIEKVVVPHAGELSSDVHPKGDQRWHAEADHPAEEAKELGKSKWSNDLDEDDIHRNEKSKGNLNALSGSKKSYSKEGKSVRWGDEVGKSGFSIAAAKTANIFSLVIGPGAGYNLKSNPLSEEEKPSLHNIEGSKRHNVFHERLRAERESFRAVFDKRRQRIGGLSAEDD